MAVEYPFDEILLDPDIFTAEAGSGSPLSGWNTYANTIIHNKKTGVHKTNVNRTDWLTVLSVNMALLTEAKREYFLNVWDGGYGSGVGLRVRVPFSYKVTDEVFGVGDGATTVFQLKITRTRPGVTARTNPHPIVKPVTNTNVSGGVTLYEPNGVTERVISTPFTLKLNNTPTSAYTINNTTGRITYSSPPGSGVILKVTMEYDLPMAFMGNSIDFRHDVASQAQSVMLREIPPVELGMVIT